MADYDLKYTGAQIDGLLDAANELKTNGFIYKGVATPSTNPGTPTERVAYLASEPGTYTNFGGIVITSGLYSLTYASGTWTGTQMSAGSDIEVVQTTGQSTSDVMSQKAVTDEINSIKEMSTDVAIKVDKKPRSFTEIGATTANFPRKSSSLKYVTITSKGTLVYINDSNCNTIYTSLLKKGTVFRFYGVKTQGVVILRYGFMTTNPSLVSNVTTINLQDFHNYENNILNYNYDIKVEIPYDCYLVFFFYNANITRQPIELYIPEDSYTTIQSVFNRISDVPITLQQGAANVDNGNILLMKNRVYSSYLHGFINCKVNDGYCIYTWVILNEDGTWNSNGLPDNTRTQLNLRVEGRRKCRLTFAKTDTSQSLSPDDNIIDYLDCGSAKRNVVNGDSIFNSVVEELYLSGTDITKSYYISSISHLYNSGYNVIVNTVYIKDSDGNIVCSFYDNSGNDEKLNKGVLRLSEYNNSGIEGYIVLNYKLIPEGTQILRNESYFLSDYTRQLKYWPTICVFLDSASSVSIDVLNLVDDDYVIATAWNYILKNEPINGTYYLRFSNNLGKTYTQTQNIYGDIVYVHFFSNGTCLFATANKCYYFSDISNIQESTLLDYDGSPYVSNCILDFFQNDQSRNDAMIVGNKEIVTWGNYSLGGSQDPNYVARVWYSADYGHTVKCAIKFGTTQISGERTPVRHVHGSLYNKYNQKFIIITGDATTECQIIEGIYDAANDVWQFNKLGQGNQFKFGDVLFREDFVYIVTDYTVQNLSRGILRCPYPLLGNYSSYQYICKIENYNGSLITTLEDDNGNKLLFPDGDGRGKIWYCKKDFDFKEIPMSESVVITNVGSPNYNGDIYARKSQGASSFPFSLKPMVNLTKSMRNSGCNDFFVQDNVLI